MKPVHEQDHNLESSLVCRYEENLTKLTQYYSQRAKKYWAIMGDRNTKFFHHAVLKRRRKNQIVSIKDKNNITHFNPEKIAHTFVDYFKDIFGTNKTDQGRPYLGTTTTTDERDYTYSIPDKEEILNTLKDMQLNASPGPDGFNGLFLKKCWHIISADFIRLVHEFHAGTVQLENLNDAYNTLIPKK